MSKQSVKTTIDANIKQNGNQEITGSILNSVLNEMVDNLAEEASTTAKLTELDSKVSNLDDDVYGGFQWEEVSETITITNNKYIDPRLAGSYSNYQDGVAVCDFVAISGSSVRITALVVNSAAKYYGYNFYDIDKNEISLDADRRFLDTSASSFYSELKEIAIPKGAKFIRVTQKLGSEFKCYVQVPSEGLIDKVIQITEDVADVKDKVVLLDNVTHNPTNDNMSPIMIDTMEVAKHFSSMSNSELISVISANANSVTISSSYAAYFTSVSPCVIGFADGTFIKVLMNAASGNVIYKHSSEVIDLTNARTIQNLYYDSMHMTSSGYLALGQFIAREMKDKRNVIERNCTLGYIFNRMTYADKKFYYEDGSLACEPYLNGFVFNPSNGISIMSANTRPWNGYVQKVLFLYQSTKDTYIEFDIPNGFGYAEVVFAESDENDSGRLDIYNNNEIVVTSTAKNAPTKVRTPLLQANNMKVRFTFTADVLTSINVVSICFYSFDANVVNPQISKFTKIAYLGDSWSQYPLVGTGINGHQFNELVVRPDGTGGDGYGYAPKEMARMLGCRVDNWGKSGMRVDNWAIPKIDTILSSYNYDFIVIEFYINDLVQGVSSAKWLANLKFLCDKCKRKGVRPILLMPSCTHSEAQSVTLGIYHELIKKGVGYALLENSGDL